MALKIIRVSLGEAADEFHGTIELVQGDITRETTDAIVNAANSELLPGGGVCGAIHRAGGPQIAEECRRLRAEGGPVPPGGAVPTTGGKLSAKYVVHAVGPVWSGGKAGEAEALASCYRESIRVADERKLKSIAFPAISTGIFGYPLREAAQVAVRAVADALTRTHNVTTVRLVMFDEPAFVEFAAALRVLNNARIHSIQRMNRDSALP
jgi:O-acetyl-ADP-ribose deacetylase (regulator of RNase III)